MATFKVEVDEDVKELLRDLVEVGRLMVDGLSRLAAIRKMDRETPGFTDDSVRVRSFSEE